MKPSSVFVLAAAVLFFVAAVAASVEGKSTALILAYASLALANIGFALL